MTIFTQDDLNSGIFLVDMDRYKTDFDYRRVTKGEFLQRYLFVFLAKENEDSGAVYNLDLVESMLEKGYRVVSRQECSRVENLLDRDMGMGNIIDKVKNMDFIEMFRNFVRMKR